MKKNPLALVATALVFLAIGCQKSQERFVEIPTISTPVNETGSDPTDQLPKPIFGEGNQENLEAFMFPAPKAFHGPTLSHWNFHIEGFHPGGANFSTEQVLGQLEALKAGADIYPEKYWDQIPREQRAVSMTEWSGELEGEAPFGPSIGDLDPERRRMIIDQKKAWMTKAKAAGFPMMLDFIGAESIDPETGLPNPEKQWELIDEALVELGNHAKATGIRLAFEFLNTRNFGDIPLAGMKGHPGQFCQSQLELLAHVEKVGKPEWVGLALDYYHSAAQNFDAWIVPSNTEASRERFTDELLEIYKTCEPYILHVHVAGAYEDPLLMRGELDLPGQLIDYKRIFAYMWSDKDENGNPKQWYEGGYLFEWVSTVGAGLPLAERQELIFASMTRANQICRHGIKARFLLIDEN